MDLFDHAAANTGEFIVRSGLPMTSDRSTKRNRQWRRPDFPFKRMSVGDAFDCYPRQCRGADGEPPLIVVQNIVSGAASTFAKNCGATVKPIFATRQFDGFVRCRRER